MYHHLISGQSVYLGVGGCNMSVTCIQIIRQMLVGVVKLTGERSVYCEGGCNLHIYVTANLSNIDKYLYVNK